MTRLKFVSYIIIISLIIFVGQGCVTRNINVKTEPSNASVYIDNKYVGETPVSIPFTHYGSHEITIEKKDADGKLMLKRMVNYEKIKPPLYEIFPLDFFSEMVLPFKFEDNHDFSYRLETLEQVPIEVRKKQLLLNAEQLRRKAMDLE